MTGLVGDLIEAGGKPPARRIPQQPGCFAAAKDLGHQVVQCRGVAGDVSLKAEVFTNLHDRHAVVADCAADQHDVAGSDSVW